ncbi:MAG TPA: hypothetical protein DC054_04910, partial [Blastocatellia bacterium]|nr:hypothetical protein [Blastocatellia bacterium]
MSEKCVAVRLLAIGVHSATFIHTSLKRSGAGSDEDEETVSMVTTYLTHLIMLNYLLRRRRQM